MSGAPSRAQRQAGGRASRCTHPGDEQPPVCDPGPGIPESQTVKRLPPSSPGSPARPRPLPGAGPGVAEALLSDPAPLQRLEGRAGHRKSSRCPAGHKAESRVARSTSPQLCAAETRGERKKKKKNQPLRDLEDSVVLSRKYTEITVFTQFAGASLRLMAVNCF